MKKSYKRVLTIAGSDSGGGAGIQADIKTFSALGCYGMSAITAITAQNTQGVAAVHPIPVPFIEKQISMVIEDIGVDAVKIGMLHSAEVIKAVARMLEKYKIENVVLDPVMVATSGDRLIKEEAIATLKSVLIPLTSIITPNLPEAGVLIGQELSTYADMTRAMADLVSLGSKAVLIKGGHMSGQSRIVDLLYYNHTVKEFSAPRIETRNNHGTGCTLSSAIAAYLAKGCTLDKAMDKAKKYITKALDNGQNYRLGKGHGPVHHFYEFWS
ncbi:bifunctional hydroxymethylpyrimidine kinase/phosphomethylpyrimidine kinase [Rapidithrix thailandica]|uniref:hydroxymethylpyrimidine kinase n=1 Tax=Rapidithrix thailandica TaxID=413964 RepID=A0AAW9S973_9BACT